MLLLSHYSHSMFGHVCILSIVQPNWTCFLFKPDCSSPLVLAMAFHPTRMLSYLSRTPFLNLFSTTLSPQGFLIPLTLKYFLLSRTDIFFVAPLWNSHLILSLSLSFVGVSIFPETEYHDTVACAQH